LGINARRIPPGRYLPASRSACGARAGPRRERPRSPTGGGDTRTGAARRSTPDLDPGVINADRLRACSTATCPHCRRVVEFGALVVQGRRLDAP